ncbi:MAG: AbrB family transcriptional regulator [Erysipelotrichaceae bacterium]|nr:AbrB family transcriptional regulator [Erysipelotrichaceae bacterium]
MNVILTLLAGVIGWRIAKTLKLPAPGMLGSMIFVALTNIFFSYAEFSMPIRIFGVSMSGAYIGMQIHRKDLKNFRLMLKPFLILIALLTINTFVIGTIIHYVCKIDWMTALLSCVAGGATDMSIIAMDLKADAGTVALMQTLRLMGTLLIFPYWISAMTKNENEAEMDDRIVMDSEEYSTFLNKWIHTPAQKIVFTMIVALISGFFGKWTKIPAGNLIFPMIVVMLVNVPTNVCYVTKKQKLVAQIIAGSVVGCSIDASTFSSFETTVLPVGILLFSYFIINYLYSSYCKKKNLLDMRSAMFASAPGGATDMTLIAADLGADLTKIALIQSFRAIYVISVMPLLISFFVYLIS